MAKDRLLDLLDRLSGRDVLVVGDLVLDEYVIGRPGRISREAPVMVLEVAERFTRPGSASNPAANLADLGARVELLGLVGQDDHGRALLGHLGAAGIATGSVIALADRPTATKTRILAEDPMGRRQQVVRVDHLPPAELDQALVSQLAERLTRRAPYVEALLLSDYKGGVVGPAIVAAARSSGKPTLVDSQGDLWRFHGCTLIKANQADAEGVLGRRLDSAEALARAGAELLSRLEAEFVVITRGAAGMSVFERGGGAWHVPGVPTEVFDVTGAGDTVIALLCLGLLAGGSILEAAQLANYAASLVVRRLGAATTTPSELRALIESSPEC